MLGRVLFIEGNVMKFNFLGYLLAAFLVIFNANAGDDSLYKIINSQDKSAFLDLLTVGYEIDEQDVEGNTPLMIASALGKANFVQFLLSKGANPNQKNYIGVTSLHRAAQGGYNDIVEKLIDYGAQVNMPDMDGITPLMKAVENEQRFTVELLVRRGAIILFRNAKGKTALDIAKEKRLSKIHTFLEEQLKNNNDNKDLGPKYSWENL